MRGEDEGCETTSDNPHNTCIQKSFNARCAESNYATNASEGVDWAVGTMVWTLFDYYGEPPSPGLEVSSTYGQYDLCGFPKAAALWYRTQWLTTISDGPDKTFATSGRHEVHIVESWESPERFPSTQGNETRSVHAYSSAPFVQLLLNGRDQGTKQVLRMVQGPGSYAEWNEVPFEVGRIEAVARAAPSIASPILARDAKQTNGWIAGLRLSVDAPNIITGTGKALLLDGQDVALLRASIVDDLGHVAHLASNNISFRVLSGPGTLLGAHNGDPKSHLPNNLHWYPAYHGLVRAVVRVTSVSARSWDERQLLARIDASGPFVTSMEDAQPIVVEATMQGYPSVTVSIPVSEDMKEAGVLAAASAAAGKPVDFFQTSGPLEAAVETLRWV